MTLCLELGREGRRNLSRAAQGGHSRSEGPETMWLGHGSGGPEELRTVPERSGGTEELGSVPEGSEQDHRTWVQYLRAQSRTIGPGSST